MVWNDANFLFLSEITKGNFIFPLNTEHKSETKDEVVGPGPAPSPCKTLCPTGVDSITTAFNTPPIFAVYELFLIRAG